MDRTPGRTPPGPRRRHRHRHRPAAARSASATDHGRAVADRGPGHPYRRGRRIRRAPPRLPPQRPAGPGAGQDAIRPRPAQGCPTPAAAHPGPTAPARRRVRLRTARHLGHTGHRNSHRNPPLRHRQGPLLGPAAPQADPPLVLGSRRRHPPDRRRDGDPPGHRPPAQRSNTQAGLAVVVRHRRHCGRRRPALAGIPTTLLSAVARRRATAVDRVAGWSSSTTSRQERRCSVTPASLLSGETLTGSVDPLCCVGPRSGPPGQATARSTAPDRPRSTTPAA